MKRRRSWGLWLLILLGIAVAFFLNLDQSTDRATKPANVRVAPDTTRITSHVSVDGLPDYLTALNDRLREGVDPSSNAEAALRRVLGPHAIPVNMRANYYSLLGIPLPEGDSGRYYQSFMEFLGNAGRPPSDSDEFDKGMKGPWSEQQLPALAAWVEHNTEQLDAVVKAVQLSHMYVPLVNSSETAGPKLMSVLLPAAVQHRELAGALICRAMLRIHRGELELAWKDIVACHRLARHVSRGGTLVEAMVGLSIESRACEGDRALAASGKLDSAMARACERTLRQLPALPGLERHFDYGERFMFLDSVLTLARHGPAALRQMFGDRAAPGSGTFDQFTKQFFTSVVDWNEVLRIGNRFYDRLAQAAAASTPAERRAIVGSIEAELSQVEQRNPLLLMAGSGKQRAQAMANLLLPLHTPAISASLGRRDRAASELQLSRMAFLLVAYRHDRGHHPSDLGDLVPDYLSEAVNDPLTGQPFVYKAERDYILLYSVGVNQRDDGGQSTPYDDIAVRIGDSQ